ncbi:hypothetical protein BC832DRAFT_204283 [Gaertneriomyces semiglobifer]|nr:hypothetical protein BC832DRAFT_204283 [Gaertneriomyces semiglobifer]
MSDQCADPHRTHGRFTRINSGIYEPLPQHFSHDLRSVVAETLQVNPHRRPSIEGLMSMNGIRNAVAVLLQSPATRSFYNPVTFSRAYSDKSATRAPARSKELRNHAKEQALVVPTQKVQTIQPVRRRSCPSGVDKSHTVNDAALIRLLLI